MLRLSLLFVAFLAAVTGLPGLVGCSDKEHTPETAMVSYEKEGFSLSHPPAWKVAVDEERFLGQRYISLDAVGISTLNVDLYGPNAEHPPALADYAAQYIALADSLLNLDPNRTPPTAVPIVRGKYQGITFDYSASLLGVDTHFIKEFYKVALTRGTAYVVFDMVEEDYNDMKKDVRVVLDSLRN